MSLFIKGDITIEELQSAMLIFKGHEIIELPDHGDLIERDAAYDSIAEQEGGNYIDMDAVYVGLHNAPTVIPAERNEE